MADPGRAYLYSKPAIGRQRSGQAPAATGSPGRQRTLQAPAAQSLPAPSAAKRPSLEDGRTTSQLDRWDLAVGNMEDARGAFDDLARTVENALYLDEDAYNQALPIHQYTAKIQAQQHRILELESLLTDTESRLSQAQGRQSISERSTDDLRQELENNAVVFKMHYTELLAKDDEITKLRAVIEGLSRK